MKKMKKYLAKLVTVFCSTVSLIIFTPICSSATELLGDVNSDGVISLSDQIALNKFLNGYYDLRNVYIADLNENYVIDIVDCKILSMFLNRNITELPYHG